MNESGYCQTGLSADNLERPVAAKWWRRPGYRGTERER